MTKETTYRAITVVLATACIISVLALVSYYTGTILNDHQTPLPGLFATATSSAEGCLIATGAFDNSAEMLFYLDSQSGRLSAGLLARSKPAFSKTYTRNIKADLAETLHLYNQAMPANPHFLMTTGQADIKQVGVSDMSRIANSVVYIAEINTGVVLVYAIPNEGDRDLEIAGGNILFWTYLRMNEGMRGIPATGFSSKPMMEPAKKPGAGSGAIKSTGHRR